MLLHRGTKCESVGRVRRSDASVDLIVIEGSAASGVDLIVIERSAASGVDLILIKKSAASGVDLILIERGGASVGLINRSDTNGDLVERRAASVGLIERSDANGDSIVESVEESVGISVGRCLESVEHKRLGRNVDILRRRNGHPILDISGLGTDGSHEI